MDRRGIIVAVAFLAVLVAAWLLLRARDAAPGATTAARAPGGGTSAKTNAGARVDGGNGAAAGAVSPAAGRLVKRGAWGPGAEEFGHRQADESNPEGPMALVAGKNGGVLVLDQTNARVSRFGADGTLLGTIPIGPDTAQDLVVDAKGRVAVIDRVGEGQLLLYDENGKPIGQVQLEGGPIDEAGGVTGVFTDSTGTWVERAHTEVVRVLGPDGQPDPDRPPAPGRPTRSGSGFVNASVASAADKAAGVATIRLFDHDAKIVWQRAVSFPASILHIAMLDSDLTGHIYLAADIAVEATTPPYALTEERIVVVRLAEADGADTGSIVLPAPTAPEESFHPLSVTDDGVVLQLLPGPDGMEIRAYTFP